MPKKDVDYAKVKAMAQSILECIGDCDDVGASPSIPEQEDDINEGGQESLDDFKPAASDSGYSGSKAASEGEKKKKSKDSAIAMMGAALASKLGGR